MFYGRSFGPHAFMLNGFSFGAKALKEKLNQVGDWIKDS
jgi:hypothetical protein